MTALYDAIGITIENTVEKINKASDEEKPERVFVLYLVMVKKISLVDTLEKLSLIWLMKEEKMIGNLYF